MTFLKDLKHSLRMFRQNPAFTLAALAALTLGIGANTAIFSVVNAVLLRPLSLPDADRLVFLMSTSPQGSGQGASPAKFAHFQQMTDVLQDIAAFRTGVVNYTGGDLPEQFRQVQASAAFFTLFGARMKLGRAFDASDDIPNAGRVVVLNESVWKRRFNSDPKIVGQSLLLSNDPFTVIGVLDEFPFQEFGQTPDVFVPFQLDPNTSDQGHYFQSAARLRPGVTLAAAQARLNASAAAYRQKFPTFGAQNSFSVEPMRTLLVRNVRPTLLVLTGAVALVLLIACANVANLLLARATGRTREIAIRAAMGGSRRRIVRQLLTESVLLAVTGGVLGLGFGLLGIRALLAVNTAGLPRVGADGALVGVDWRVAAFAIGVSVVTGIVFGLVPALSSSRTDLTTSLKEAGGRAGTGARQNWTRSILVVTEVALALILLIGSALLIRTAVALARVEPGFDATNVLTMRTSLTGPQFQSSAGVTQMTRTAIERLQALPMVERASTTCCLPLQGGYGLPFQIIGKPVDTQNPPGGGWGVVSPGYFEVFKIPIKRGRAFTDQDTAGSAPVVIINETLARQFFPEMDPLAARLAIGRGVMREFATEPERQIVGVVGDSRDGGLNNDPQPQMFIPQSQVPDAVNALNVRLIPTAWVVRTRVAPAAASQAIQEELRKATGLPITNVESMGDIVSTSTSRQRFNMWLMSVFGGCALLLAAIGIYGLLAYSVAQRRQEIGIRLALGAPASQVRNMVVRQGMVLSAIGAAIGISVSLYLARFLTQFLFQVQQWDPVVFTAVPAILLLVALVAVWIPARRASHVDPLKALRAE